MTKQFSNIQEFFGWVTANCNYEITMLRQSKSGNEELYEVTYKEKEQVDYYFEKYQFEAKCKNELIQLLMEVKPKLPIGDLRLKVGQAIKDYQ